MAVQNFALDPTGNYRVQVQWASDNEPAYILLNGSHLGQFYSIEERLMGKAFTLPDNSQLHVRFMNEQPQAFRMGMPLPIAPALADPKPERKRSTRVTIWLIANLVIFAIFTIVNALAFLGAPVINSNVPPSIFLIFTLMGIGGIVGISALLAWKKWGFFLVAGYIVLNFILALIFHGFNLGSIILLATGARLYVWLNRSGVWERLD
ncbi:MAG TPA: hypothetical protein VHZ51_16615 [Ktedonobacteraceae bacterium]|nr:hypothetical protein [Ktedonobacteraceae bacterium]